MSKIIVDEIQKNGGDTLTLPSTDATADNQPMVGSSTGALSFSPLAMPSADGDANKPMTTDGSGQLQFGGFALPATAGSDGQVLTSTGTAAAWEAPGAGFTHAYELDFSTTPASTATVLWTDIFGSGTTVSDIKLLQLHFYGISAASSGQVYIYGRDSGGDTTAANYGGMYQCVYSSGSVQSSNNAETRWKFPGYTSQAQTDYSYGSGMTGQVNMVPRKEGTYGNMGCSYFLSFDQSTSYNYPSIEYGGWNNYSNDSSFEEWTLGMRITHTGGNINRGRIIILGRK